MNPIFSLKNFRSFGEDGADFELAPITVLTGCNSAGKSSLVKALMLLSNSLKGVGYTENLKLSSKDLCLGGYKNVAHKESKIIMSYKIWSADLQEIIVVTRKYCAKRNDELNDGELNHLTVEKLDGTIIYQAGPLVNGQLELDQDGPRYDSIRVEFCRFYAVGCYMRIMELLPHIERRENDCDNPITSDTYRSENVVRIVKERLKSAGVNESDAVLLWNEYNHDTFNAIINAMDTTLGLVEKRYVTIPDLIKTPDEDAWDFMKQQFINRIVDDALSPLFTKQPIYINSASAQIERLYTVENENKMSNALRELNRRKGQYHDDLDFILVGPYSIHKPGSFLDKWLYAFKIGKGLNVRGTDQGLGLMAYLTNEKDEERLLADEGYGITQLVALLLQIDNCIPVALGCNENVYIKEHKEVYNYQQRIIFVEEPEVHLHPKYQSLLANMFVEAYQKYNIHFIIETHSEYLIRKLQVLVAEKKLEAEDVSLNYVEKNEEGVSHNRQIKIKDDGRLDGSFGEGFYDEAGGLSRQLFMLNDEQ